MSKFIVTYEVEIDNQDFPDHALAAWLTLADHHGSDWNVWEIAGTNMRLINVEVANG